MLATAELLEEAAQPHRLAAVLPGFLNTVPLYQAAGRATAMADPAGALEVLGRLPRITKQDIRRDFPRNFLGAAVELEDLLDRDVAELEHTSGTSEERTALLLPRGWWAEQERRALRLNPVVAAVLAADPQARRVTIGSPNCNNDICYTGVPSRNERIVGQTLHVSLSRFPFLWSERDLERMAAEAIEWQPQFLDVDPVYGVAFARYCERRSVRLPSLKFILTSYEFTSVVHRRLLERVFRVPVFDLYGSTETGHLLMEDGEGRQRASLETAFLEVLDVDAAGIGALVVTTLSNELMPLVRYHIGDLVERHALPYSTRYRVHGRLADAFKTPGGRRVTTWHIDRCFDEIAGIAHYQLIQHPGEWRLRYVADSPAPEPAALKELQSRLTELLEASPEVILEPTDLLLAENSGKFKLGYPLKG